MSLEPGPAALQGPKRTRGGVDSGQRRFPEDLSSRKTMLRLTRVNMQGRVL